MKKILRNHSETWLVTETSTSNGSMYTLPGSPSWRSNSPNRVSYRGQQSDGPSWVREPSTPRPRRRRPRQATGSTSPLRTFSAPQQATSAPFLTVALFQLRDVLPVFLERVSVATMQGAAHACACFEITATPHQEQQPLPPLRRWFGRTTAVSPTVTNLASVLSPSSPTGLHSSTGGGSSVSSSASSSYTSGAGPTTSFADEWDHLVATPFWLWAAAAVMTQDLEPLRCVGRRSNLPGLYSRIIQDLHRLQHLLCEPLMHATAGVVIVTSDIHGISSLGNEENLRLQNHGDERATSTGSSPRQGQPSESRVAAQVVHSTLETCMAILTAMGQWVELLVQQVQQQQQQGPPLIAGIEGILYRLTSHRISTTVPESTKALYRSTVQRLRAFKHALEACAAIEECRFYETVMAMQTFKKSLPLDDENQSTSETAWLRQIFQRLSETRRICFDRTLAFSGPLYCLCAHAENQREVEPSEIETEVLDFLRKQVKLNGPPTVVTIILDSTHSGNFFPERGYQVYGDQSATHEVDARVRWPAVFMRSTLYSVASTTVPTSSSSRASLLSRKGDSRGTLRRSPNSSRQGSRSSGGLDGSSIFGKQSHDPRSEPSVNSLMEYGPEDGVATSWPHSDWEALTDYLDRDSLLEESKAKPDGLYPEPMYKEPMTYRDAEETMEDGPVSAADGEHALSNLFRVPVALAAPVQSPLRGEVEPQPPTTSSSTFHLVSISKFLTLAVIVKTAESRRSGRKHSQLTDPEIHHFLNSVVSKLRKPTSFGKIPPSRIPLDEPTGEPVLSLQATFVRGRMDPPWTNDLRVRHMVAHVKNALGKERSFTGVDSSWWPLSIPFSSSRSQHEQPRDNLPDDALDMSAAALFLGPELYQQVV